MPWICNSAMIYGLFDMRFKSLQVPVVFLVSIAENMLKNVFGYLVCLIFKSDICHLYKRSTR